MKKLTFKDNTYIDLPENMEEVTFAQYLGLLESDEDQLQAVAVLTNTSKIDWAESNNTNLFYYCKNALFGEGSWLVKGLNEIVKNETASLVMQSRGYTIDDLGSETVAQFEDLRILVNRFHEKYQASPIAAMREYYPLMCAIYLQPKVCQCKYDYSEAKKFAKEVNNLPCTVVVGVTNFFLARYVASLTGINGNAQKPSSRPRRWMQGLATFLVRSVLRQRLTRLRRAISRRRITLNSFPSTGSTGRSSTTPTSPSTRKD